MGKKTFLFRLYRNFWLSVIFTSIFFLMFIKGFLLIGNPLLIILVVPFIMALLVTIFFHVKDISQSLESKS